MKSYTDRITATDGEYLRSSKTYDKDINNLIRTNDITASNDFYLDERIRKTYMFTDVNECLCFIQNNPTLGKIFFITSGRLGAEIVPRIYDNNSIYMIYILAIYMAPHIDWAINYDGKLKMFDNELDLLSRLTRDIAFYYESKSRNNAVSPRTILVYLYWAKRLLANADMVDKKTTPSRHFLEIEKRITDLELCIDPYSVLCNDFEEKVKISVECSEK